MQISRERDRKRQLIEGDLLRVINDVGLRSPAMNIGLEEAIAKEVSEGRSLPTVRYWRNPYAAIIGRSQEAEVELDLADCRKAGVPVIRRPTGGGAVLHHPNNLNYSLYLLEPSTENVEAESLRLSRPVARAVEDLGIDPEVRRNGLFLGETKIGGTAQSRRWGLLHHGTLLVNDSPLMDNKDSFLRAGRDDYPELEAQLASEPAAVSSLDNYLSRGPGLSDLLELLTDRIAVDLDKIPVQGAISRKEWNFAASLAEEKYSTNPWNFRFHKKGKEAEKVNK